MNQSIPENQALVITGPQGAGKSVLAVEIAMKEGDFVEVFAHELDRNGGLDSAIANSPKVIICDGFPTRAETLQRIKQMITEPTTRINVKYRTPATVNSPKFIFCTGDFDPIPDSLRFAVVKLRRQAATAT